METLGKHVQGKDLALFNESRAIPIFLLITLLISSVFYFLIIKSGHMGGGWGGYGSHRHAEHREARGPISPVLFAHRIRP